MPNNSIFFSQKYEFCHVLTYILDTLVCVRALSTNMLMTNLKQIVFMLLCFWIGYAEPRVGYSLYRIIFEKLTKLVD